MLLELNIWHLFIISLNFYPTISALSHGKLEVVIHSGNDDTLLFCSSLVNIHGDKNDNGLKEPINNY